MIASHNQGAEAESTAALNDFRATIDEHDFLRGVTLGHRSLF
jgi:hypothetical protein